MHRSPPLLRWNALGLSLLMLVGMVAVQLAIAVATSAPASAATSGAVTFSFTGSAQSWQVPAGITAISVDARGSQGGGGWTNSGLGGRVTSTLPVTPGETLGVYVGGTNGFNGGGASSGSGTGGGASDIREGGSGLANRILVAGGGGAAGYGDSVYASGGSGGGSVGEAGEAGNSPSTGGGGGTQSAGGAGGANNAGSNGVAGNPGTLGTGGAGVSGPSGYANSGGGGGGYYGGGSGGAATIAGSGGGGGSTYLESSATNSLITPGYNAGNGQIVIRYPPQAAPAPPSALPNSVTYSSPGLYSLVVPGGISSIGALAEGAAGGGSGGGPGGAISATLPVTPGQDLIISVGTNTGGNSSEGPSGGGGLGWSGYPGSPGGGASDIRLGGAALGDRVLVAGGGGGTSYSGTSGGAGGASTGATGAQSFDSYGGAGGSQSSGGVGGTVVQPACNNTYFGGGTGANGSAGTFGIGGAGGSAAYTGGGGGGGYYGGGGGGTCDFFSSGGGGGSSYAEASATGVTSLQGAVSAATGEVVISWGFTPSGGPIPALMRMAENKVLNTISCSCADPVDASTGNLSETIDDLSIPGRGEPLDFSHSYNSLLAASNGPLGYGWTDSYNMSLSLGSGTPPVTATVNQEDGTQVYYSVSGTAYTAPSYVMATLVHNGDGSWTYTRRNTQIFSFNASGQLTAESDLNGYTTSLSYNGSGQLATVTDPEGRTLTLTWTGGLITKVQDSSGRAVTFEYNDANGDLTDVIDADGGHTVYTYDASHNLVTMTRPMSTATRPPTRCR